MEDEHSDLTMSRALKQEDERELSKLYESEFNKPDLHDRILIFDVVASRRLCGASLEVNVSDENEEIRIEASTEDGSHETTKTENVETGVNTSDASQDCEIITNGNQKFKNKSNNKDSSGLSIGTATSENETQKTEVTNKQDTVPNENVETRKNTSNANKTEGQHESEITKDKNGASPNQSYGQSGREMSSESNDETSYLSSEGKILRQHKFYIHSTWLAVQSSYFRSLFFSGMKESSTKEVHVQISTSEEKAHLMLLEAMYKIDTLDDASVDELLEVLRLADKYDVKFVFKKCKYCLQNMVDTLEICEHIMCFIKIDNSIPDVEDLASTLQSFLAKEFSPLDKTWQTTSFKDLCKPSLKYLLSSDELVTGSEGSVFHALMYWIEEHGIENVLQSQELPSLLSVVRFELIPVDYLYNNVQHNPVAKKLPDFNDHYLRGISYHALSKKIIKESLPSQPVKRKDGTFVPYTWSIPIDKLDALVETDEDLKSDEFWFCGYKGRLTVSHVKGVKSSNTSGSSGDNSANLSLEILNLRKGSVVEIVWRPCGEHFHSQTNDDKKHTFKNNAHISTFEIDYYKREKAIQGKLKRYGRYSVYSSKESPATLCLIIDLKMNIV